MRPSCCSILKFLGKLRALLFDATGDLMEQRSLLPAHCFFLVRTELNSVGPADAKKFRSSEQ